MIMDVFEKQRFCAEGQVNVKGKTVLYSAVSENFPIERIDGTVDGSTFTFSYIRKDIEDTNGRPVLFAWNGGPGAASVFVNLGLLAPMRVKCGSGIDLQQTAPFEMTENHHCILDVCDIVVVDAMGTGYAEVFSEEGRKYWFSTEKDAESIIQTIRKWMTAHGRWNSPLYIMGESFGTIRNALVAEGIFCNSSDAVLQHISGVIMLGSALDYGQKEFPIEKSVLNLPSIAAAQWYWHSEGKGSLEEFIEECYQFCYQEYLQALAMGSLMEENARRNVAEKLSRYTGYSVEKLLQDNLKVEIFQYPAMGLAEEGKTIGIYDARFALGKCKEPQKYDFFSDDACNAIGMPAFLTCFNAFWKKALHIDLEREYKLLDMSTENFWNFKTKSYPPEALEKAMHRNPKLKLMFGMGQYDMLTTLGWCRYLVSHYDYPQDRTVMKYYAGGHMPYLGDDLADQLNDDLRTFILK